MPQKHSFTGVIENPGDGGAFVRVPLDVEQVFGKKRVSVKATINGEFYRGTLVRMGEPCHVLIILKEIRRKIGKDFGDEVNIVLEEDTEPRVVEIPSDFQKALDQNLVARDVFEKMSYTHRKEYVNAILDARRVETRNKRIARTIEILKDNK